MEDEVMTEAERVSGGVGKKKKRIRKCDRKKLTASLFRVNGDSEGGRVKDRNEVVMNRVKKCEGSQPHVNCRVQTFGLIMKGFSELKLGWVKELGMGGLLNLVGKNLPRSLCYWLMTKVDPLNKVFLFSNELEYPLDRSQVYWVLGIPNGPNAVPCEVSGATMSQFVEEVYEKYGIVTKCGTRYVSVAKLMEVVEGDCGPEEELDFKVAFLALALSDVLCPTTCMRLAKDLIPALYVARDAASYDWCGLVLDKLLFSAKRFAEKFYVDGYVKGVGGCTYFLAIFYLDHLRRPPVRWGIFPRVKAWTEDEVKEAKNADRLTDSPCSDYGKMKSVDVAYGERHPLAARDTMGPPISDIVVSKNLDEVCFGGVCEVRLEPNLSFVLGQKDGRMERRKGPRDGSNPYVRRIAKRHRNKACEGSNEGLDTEVGVEEIVNDTLIMTQGIETVGGMVNNVGDEWETVLPAVDEVNVGVEDAIMFAEGGEVDDSEAQLSRSFNVPSFKDTGTMREEEKKECREEVGNTLGSEDDGFCSGCNDDGSELNGNVVECSGYNVCVEEGKLCRSRPRRGTKPSVTLSQKDFEVEVLPRQNPKFKGKLVKFVCTAGAIIKDEALLEDDKKTQQDMVLLKVGDLFATVVNCYSVVASLHGGVDDNYVRVAAALYRKKWKSKYVDSGTRYMVDLTYAMRAFQEVGPPSGWNDCRRLAKIYVKDFSKPNALRVHVISVPVLEDGHWWCAAFCVNNEQIWIIDSLSKSSIDCHQYSLWKLCAAVDILLSTLDFAWVPGKICDWPRRSVGMENQVDGDSCGIQMLLAIKACASRYQSEFQLRGDIAEERAWLLNDDLLDDENELKEVVKRIVLEYDG